MAEIAGLMLGVAGILPVNVQIVQAYKKVHQVFRAVISCSRELRLLDLTLRVQEERFLNGVGILVRHVNHDARVWDMIENSAHPSWKDKELDVRMRHLLNSRYDLWVKTVQAINIILQELSENLAVFEEVLAQRQKGESLRKTFTRLRKTLKFDRRDYERHLNRLRHANEDLETLLKQIAQSYRSHVALAYRMQIERHFLAPDAIRVQPRPFHGFTHTAHTTLFEAVLLPVFEVLHSSQSGDSVPDLGGAKMPHRSAIPRSPTSRKAPPYQVRVNGQGTEIVTRFVRFFWSGLSIPGIAADLQIGLRTAYSWQKNLLRYGSVMPPTAHVTGRPNTMSVADERALRETLMNTSWMYQDEMVHWLWEERGVVVSQSTVSRTLNATAGLRKALQLESTARSDQVRSEYQRRTQEFAADREQPGGQGNEARQRAEE